MTKDEKFKELYRLYAQLDDLDRNYELLSTMGEEDSWLEDSKYVNSEINRLKKSLTDEEMKEWLSMD